MGIGDLLIKALSRIRPAQQTNPVFTQQYKQEREYQQELSENYFSSLDVLESQWSVISNLKIFNSDQAKEFEKLCYENLRQYFDYADYMISIYPDSPPISHVPAFVRLAMLYERQGDYDKAIAVCVKAIKCGAVNDGSNGKMYGRLARMIRKSGKEVSPDILALTTGDKS